MVMNEKFEKIISTFPTLMQKLNESPFMTRENMKRIPERGVYVFYEGKNPKYVGRSERLRSRLHEHSKKSSGHTSATFAFNLAKKRAERKGIDVDRNRKILEKDPDFLPIYNKEKVRVSKMKIKVIRINNPVIQTLFEVYVSIELNTKQDWGTH